MYSRFIKSLSLVLALVALSTASLAQKEKPIQKERHELTPKEIKELSKKGFRPPSGKSFFIAPTQVPLRYSVLLCDDQNRTVTNLFQPAQLMVFEAVIEEAQKFAETEEAAGTDKPIITRFMDKSEPALFIDVAKKGLESRFYITLVGIAGKLTVDGGSIKRGEKPSEHKGLFYDMIQKIEIVKSQPPPQQ